MRTFIIPSVLVCALVCGCAGSAGGSGGGGDAGSSDHVRIQGVWLAQTESLNGHTKDVTFVYVFAGDTLAFKDETGKETRYTFTLDKASDLKLMTIRPVGTPASASPVSVAYELKGDSLTIVIAPPGLCPTELSDRNDQELIVCKRSAQPVRR